MNATVGYTAEELLAAAPGLTRAIFPNLHEDPMRPLQVLAIHEWTPKDMGALDAKWGSVCAQTNYPADVREILNLAGRLSAAGFLPVQARAWVDRLWTVGRSGADAVLTDLGEAAIGWLAATGHHNHPNEEGDFAAAYRDAAFGDMDAALVIADLDNKMLMPEQVDAKVGEYVTACGGDQDLALAAIKARFDVADIAAHVAAGTAKSDALAMLVALHVPIGD